MAKQSRLTLLMLFMMSILTACDDDFDNPFALMEEEQPPIESKEERYERLKDLPKERWLIAPNRVDCIGVTPQKCFLIKPSQEPSEWKYHFSEIEGFQFEEGYQYDLIVAQEQLEEVPMDRSLFQYHLVEILEKRNERGPKSPLNESTDP